MLNEKRINAFITRSGELSEKSRDPSLSSEERVAIRAELKALLSTFLEDTLGDLKVTGATPAEIAAVENTIERTRKMALREPTSIEIELAAFGERLKNRQGTTMPDFGALYKKKDDLDRKAFGDP